MKTATPQTRVKNSARAIALTLYKVEKKVIAVLLVAVFALSALYMYFLASAVLHAVVRKEVQHTIADAHSRIADLEVSYLQRKDTVTESLAADMGFSSVAQKDYVERARYLGRAQ